MKPTKFITKVHYGQISELIKNCTYINMNVFTLDETAPSVV